MKRIAAKCLGKPGSGRGAQLWQTTFKGNLGFILQIADRYGAQPGKVYYRREGETDDDVRRRANDGYRKAV